MATSSGLGGGAPVGAADNGDGGRLLCGAGLVPATADGRSNWVGGVVMTFTRDAPCSDPIPSSALTLLRAAAAGNPDTWNLTDLGWLYAILIALVTAVAAWACTARRWWSPVVLLAPLAPLASPTFTRFFLSTYSEPAGLLGAYTLLAGVAALAVTSQRARDARLVAVALTAAGAFTAGTAKVAYLPLLVVGVAVCATATVLVSRRRKMLNLLPGVAVAAGLGIAALAPTHAALSWQSRDYPAVNAHNLIFTTLLPEVGAGAASQVGLPVEAAAHAGRGFYGPSGAPLDPDSVPGWRGAVGDDPGVAQQAAQRALLSHPDAFLTAVGVAMQATRGADVDYLQSGPVPAGTAGPLQIIDSPQMGKDVAWMRAWLGSMPAPWLSSLLAVLGLLVGAAGLRTGGALAGFTRLAGVASAAATGLAVLTVLGDGYYEIAKHMWPAAYLLVVVAMSSVGAGVVLLGRGIRRRTEK
ncbi:hypothetical protein ACQP04_00695 [Pseudonocardia halophobica]|uniref:glycan biosynthesis hexose transferase WsfD n=1 Tax=Pseudonocardia halophobica TaxID=29401 RepID=UPI003D90F458